MVGYLEMSLIGGVKHQGILNKGHIMEAGKLSTSSSLINLGTMEGGRAVDHNDANHSCFHLLCKHEVPDGALYICELMKSF